MYFETGQGSELSSNGHHGVDQVLWKQDVMDLLKSFLHSW